MAILAPSDGACLMRQPDARQNVCNSMNTPTPTAGPNTVATTSIMNDFATITLPRTTRRHLPRRREHNRRNVAGDPLKISSDLENLHQEKEVDTPCLRANGRPASQMRSAVVLQRAGNAPCNDKISKSANALVNALEDQRETSELMHLRFLLPKQPVDAWPACISLA